jgi:hypothetical protein
MGDAHVLSVDARKLMRRIVAECLKAQGLPSHRQSVSAAIELIEAGFAVIRSDGENHWLEATNG